MKGSLSEFVTANAKAVDEWLKYFRTQYPETFWVALAASLTPVWFEIENKWAKRIGCVSCGGNIALCDLRYYENDPAKVRCYDCTINHDDHDDATSDR